MEKLNGTDRAVLRIGTSQFIGLVLALIPIAQNALVKNGELQSFTLIVPRPIYINAPRRINFVPKAVFYSIGKEPGYEYFVFVPAITLSPEIQKQTSDYLALEKGVSLIVQSPRLASIFRF